MNFIMISGYAGSGKDTVANILSKGPNCQTLNNGSYVIHTNESVSFKNINSLSFNYITKRISLATPLKFIAKELLGWDGLKNEAGRNLLIFLGDYLGDELTQDFYGFYETRNPGNFRFSSKDNSYFKFKDILESLFNKDKLFWVKILLNKCLEAQIEIANTSDNRSSYRTYFIIPDFRHKKEYYYLKACGHNVKTLRVVRSNKVTPLDTISERDLDDFNYDILISNLSGLEDLTTKIQYNLDAILSLDSLGTRTLSI